MNDNTMDSARRKARNEDQKKNLLEEAGDKRTNTINNDNTMWNAQNYAISKRNMKSARFCDNRIETTTQQREHN